MAHSPFAAFPSHPPGIAEWEELLLRYEIVPRALANTVEEIPGEGESAVAVLDEALARELWTQSCIEALRAGGELPVEAEAHEAVSSVEEGVRRTTLLRTRNFTMLQRRGVDVWAWTGQHPEHGPVTAFQLFSLLLERDAELLRRLRALRGERRATC